MRSLPDLYRLTREELLGLDGFEEISATNVVAAIEASSSFPSAASCSGSTFPTSGG